MKYLCLVYTDERLLMTMDKTQQETFVAECQAFNQALLRDGMLLEAEALEPVTATLQPRDGRLLVTQRLVTKTKAQPDSFYLLEARDLNQAIQLAGRMPPARYGCIDVRPVGLSVRITPSYP